MRERGKGKDDVTVKKTETEDKIIVLADRVGKTTKAQQEMISWCHEEIKRAARRLAEDLSERLSRQFESFTAARATIRLELRRREVDDGETD